MGGQRGRLIDPVRRAEVLNLVTEAVAAGARYQKACELLELSLRTLQRWKKEQGLQDKRKAAARVPRNKLSPEEEDVIMNTLNSEAYRDLPPCKIVPLLADAGRYLASESTIYRLLRAANQLTHRVPSQAPKHHRPEAYEAFGPNQVWSWDITYLPSQVKGLFFYLYLIMDIYSRKIVGFAVHEAESASYAAALAEQTCLDEKVQPHQVVLHADNGGPMKGATMLAKLESLGVLPSFSRPSVSDDNPYSEALFRTLKYHPSFPALERFATLVDARRWCEQFVRWYNGEHLHSGLKFITPAQRHNGADEALLAARHTVYELAKKHKPERWSRNTRNWELPLIVSLNPNKKRQENKADVLSQVGLIPKAA